MSLSPSRQTTAKPGVMSPLSSRQATNFNSPSTLICCSTTSIIDLDGSPAGTFRIDFTDDVSGVSRSRSEDPPSRGPGAPKDGAPIENDGLRAGVIRLLQREPDLAPVLERDHDRLALSNGDRPNDLAYLATDQVA